MATNKKTTNTDKLQLLRDMAKNVKSNVQQSTKQVKVEPDRMLADAAKRQQPRASLQSKKVNAYNQHNTGDVPAYRRRSDTPAGIGVDIHRQRRDTITNLLRDQTKGMPTFNLENRIANNHVGATDARKWAQEYRDMGQIGAADWFDNAADILEQNSRAGEDYIVKGDPSFLSDEQFKQWITGDWKGLYGDELVDPNVKNFTEPKNLTGNDLKGNYNVMLGYSQGAANMAGYMGSYADQARNNGDYILEKYYRDMEPVLNKSSQQYAEQAAEMIGPEARKRMAADIDLIGKDVNRVGTELITGSDTHSITDAERSTAASNIDSKIAQYDDDIAALEAEKAALEQEDSRGNRKRIKEIEDELNTKYTLRDSYVKAKDTVASDADIKVYDDDALRDIESYEGLRDYRVMLEDAFMDMTGNLDFAVEETKRLENIEMQESWIRAVGNDMIANGYDPATYINDQSDFDKWLYNDDDLHKYYTDEERGMLLYAEQHMPNYTPLLREVFDVRADGRRNEAWADKLTDTNPAVNLGLAVGGRIFSTINGADISIQNWLGFGKTVNYERTGFGTVLSDKAMERGMEDIDAWLGDGTINEKLDGVKVFGQQVKVPILGDLKWSDLYSSGADSLTAALNSAAGPYAAPVVTGLQAYASGYHEAKERGASDEQAKKNSRAQAFNEGLGEKVSYDVFLKYGVENGWFKGAWGKVALGAARTLDEAQQEGATQWLNEFAEDAFMGASSQRSIDIQNYVAAGYTPEEAAAMADEARGDRIAKAAIMGAIGGLSRGVSQGTIGTVRDVFNRESANAAIGRDIRKSGNTENLTQQMSLITGKDIKAPRTNRGTGKLFNEYVKAVGKDPALAMTASKMTGTSAATKKTAETRKSEFGVSEDGRTTVGGKDVKIQGINDTKKASSDIRVNVTYADNTTGEVKLSDINFGDDKAAEVYSYAADMPTPSIANIFRTTMKTQSPDNIDRIATGFTQAYDMGRAGYRNIETVANSPLTKALTAEQVKMAYEQGVADRAAAQQKNVKEVSERVKAAMGKEWKGGTVTFDRVDAETLNDTQKRQVELATAISGMLGINVRFYESGVRNNTYQGANGSYNRKTNTISLDINAGRNRVSDSIAQTALLKTMSHEITHAIQRNSPEQYEAIREAVLDVIGKAKGVSLDTLVNEKMVKDKSLKSREAAVDEVVADACETMLRDSDAVKQLMEAHPEAAKTFKDTVLRILDKLLEAIRAAFNGNRASRESQLIEKEMKSISELWSKAVVEVAEVSGREIGDFAVTSQGAVVSKELAEYMESNNYDPPHNEWYSIRETDTWAEAHRKEYPNDADFEHNLALVQAFDRNVAADRENNDGIVLSPQDVALFYQKWGEIKAGKQAEFQKTSDGYYIFAINNKLVYTKGGYVKPGINYVIEIATEDETDIDSIRHLIFETERGEIYHEHARTILEDLFGKEIVRGFDTVVHRADARQNRRGEGATRREIYKGTEGQEVGDQYSSRDYDEPSDREILMNALKSAAKDSTEVSYLLNYKKQLADLEAKQIQLDRNNGIIKQLLYKKGRTAEENKQLDEARTRAQILRGQLSVADSALLKLEVAAPLRNIVEQGKLAVQMHDAAAMAKFKREWLEQYEKRYEALAERHRLMKDTQNRATRRASIIRRVKRLDQLVRNATDHKHIPDGLGRAIIDLMQNFTQDTSVFDKKRLVNIQNEYALLKDSKLDSGSLYTEDMHMLLAELGNLIGGRRLSALSFDELSLVRDIIGHFEKLVKDANSVFVNGRRQNIDEITVKLVEETSGKNYKASQLKASNLYKWLTKGQITPIYFFEQLGGEMGRLGKAIIEGQGRFGVLADKAHTRIRQIKQQYGYDTWAHKKGDTKVFITEEGKSIELTREQALGIYATAKRERSNRLQKASHLAEGGVILQQSVKDLPRIKGKEVKYEGTPLSNKDVSAIEAWLTDQQKEYADAMVGYISKDMAELGNETSMKLHGYRKFGEGYYYPYKTSSDFRKTDLGKVENALMKNMSFTHRVQRHADNPIVLSDFSQTVAEHVEAMLRYNAMAVEQDSFMRVYDHHLSKSETVQTLLKNAYGKNTTDYIIQFMKDIYGGVTRDSNEAIGGKWLARYKKSAVMFSLSTAIQQPSSLPRAFAEVNMKYFVGKAHTGSFKEAKRYAGTAVIKDMGSFDTYNGRNAADWLNDTREKTWLDRTMRKIDNVGGYLPEKLDQMSWGTIWEAVKREQADKTGLDINSEELKVIAGKRFDEVVTKTQVFDSVMAKSQNMRDNSLWMKMVTSFMGEPTVTYNMLYNAIANAKTNPGKASAVLGSVLLSIILNAALKSIVTGARDDDDEQARYGERYVKNFFADLVNGLNPLEYIPFVKDAWSIFKGFKVERTDMEAFNLAYDFWKLLQDEDRTWDQTLNTTTAFVSMLTGLPFKNIWKDISGAKNTFQSFFNKKREGRYGSAVKRGLSEGAILSLWFDDSKSANVDAMYEHLLDGDLEAANDSRKYLIDYNGVKDDKAVNTLLRTRIKEGFEDGDISREKAAEMLHEHTGLTKTEADRRVSEWAYKVDTNVAYGDVKEKFMDGDMAAEEAIEARVEYGGADEEDAEATIRKWEYEKETGFAYDDMKDNFMEGKITASDAVDARVKYGGVERSKAEETVNSWRFEREHGYAYADLRTEYEAGNVDYDEAHEALTEVGGKDDNEAYWQIAEWDYEKSGGEWHGKTTIVNDAFAGGNANNVRTAMHDIASHSDWKKPGNELASIVTDYYKPIYEAASDTEKVKLRRTILDYIKMGYEVVGEEYYGDDYALRYRSWLRD